MENVKNISKISYFVMELLVTHSVNKKRKENVAIEIWSPG
jgi:hypothetical protein